MTVIDSLTAGRGVVKTQLPTPMVSRLPVPYVADAVHFDGSTYLSTASLTATDSGKWSVSLWVNFDALPVSGAGQSQGLLNHDLADSDTSGYGLVAIGDTAPNIVEFDLYNTGETEGVFTRTSLATTFAAGVWYHVLFSVDASAFPYKQKLYINDVDVTLDNGSSTAPVLGVFNGVTAFVGSSDGALLTGAMADVWDAPNVSLLDGGGDIPVATRRLFISASGKPVNPSGFPASAMLFSGNATTFASNQGTGGAFTTTGALTNASTSPGE